MTDKYEDMPVKIRLGNESHDPYIHQYYLATINDKAGVDYIRADHHQALVQALEEWVKTVENGKDWSECYHNAKEKLAAAKEVDNE